MSMKSLSMKVGDWTFNYSSLRDFEFDISEPHNTADYIIFGEDTDGDGIADIVYAKNGRTGKIEFQDTHASNILNPVIQKVLSSGGGKITGYIFPALEITEPILIYHAGTPFTNYAPIELSNLSLIASPTLSDEIIKIQQSFYVSLKNLLINGNYPNNSNVNGIVLDRVYISSFENIIVKNIYGFGILALPNDGINTTLNFKNIHIHDVQNNAGMYIYSSYDVTLEMVVVEHINNPNAPAIFLSGTTYDLRGIYMENVPIGLKLYYTHDTSINGLYTSSVTYYSIIESAGTTNTTYSNIHVDSDVLLSGTGRNWGNRCYLNGKYGLNSGTYTVTGDGTTTTFTIPHGLVSAPSYVNITPQGGAPMPDSITADATNITLTYSTAPSTTDTYTYWWEARV